MKNYTLFIKKSLAFIIAFLITIFLIQSFVFFLLSKISVGEFGVLNRINEGGINAEILINGSSRAYKGIDPSIIENETGKKCYNIATDGGNLGIQISKLKWYLNKNEKPEIIIQEIGQLGESVKNVVYEPYKYIAYLSDDSLYSGLLKLDSNFWEYKYLYPVNLTLLNFDFYALLSSELVKSAREIDYLKNGYYSDNSKWASSMENVKNRLQNGIYAHVDEPFKEYLSELVQLCKQKEIKLMLVTAPYYYEILEITRNTDTVIKYYNTFDELEFIFYFNYSSLPISNDTLNYYNYSHLNTTGATKFSRTIAAEILNIK